MAYSGLRARSARDYKDDGFISWSKSPDASTVVGYAVIGMILAVAIYMVLTALSANRLIYSSPPLAASDGRFISDRIRISGGGNVVVEVDTTVDNASLDLELRLISDARKVAYVVRRGIEYSHGSEGGERWAEGSRRSVIYFSRIPAGTYVLEAFPVSGGGDVAYGLRVYRDRVRASYLWWVLGWFAGWIVLIALARSKGS